VAFKRAAENQLAAVPGKAFLIEVVAVADNMRWRHPDHLVTGFAVLRMQKAQRDDFAFHDSFTPC
jgi:hypothetical protein